VSGRAGRAKGPSTARTHGRPGPSSATGPAPAGSLVAVLERRGRFLTAEPLFPRRDPDAFAPSRGRSNRLVLKAGAHAPRSGSPAGAHARAGDLVLVAGARRSAQARIVRVLGRPDVARDVIEALMLDRGLRRGFDPGLERDAREAGQRVAGEQRDRHDLRSLATFTIDPASARDFDDAISAQELDDGLTRVWVHIADVAAHVPEGSPLDREARMRATSVYVPGAVEPMLPHALSSDACSLMPGADRAAVTVELELDGAEVVRAAFYRSLIRSDARLDYEQVDRVFAGSEHAADPWREPLAAARRVAAALADKRESAGALVIESEEPEFQFDELGNVRDVRPSAQTESHRVIEHLMIAANEAVARLLDQQRVPCLYRVHERPDPERVERLVAQLASLGVPTPPLREPMSSTQAADLLGEISRRVDLHVRRTGRGRIALGSLVLRSLKQAYYSPANIGHAGLHSTAYCHFTSPIRRYPDIVCHRALLSAVGAGERAPRAGELAELGAWTSERERDAMVIERDADKVACCFALQRLLTDLGGEHVFAGEVSGLIPAGAFVAFSPDVQRDQAASAQARGDGRQARSDGSEARGDGRQARGDGRQARGDGSEARGDGRQPDRQAAAASAPPFEGMLAVRRLGSPSAQREWWELNEQGTIMRGERSGAVVRLGDPIDVRVERIDAIRGRVDLVGAR
jgi:ribonuclease R